MRVIADILDSFTGIVRMIVGGIVLMGLVFGLMMTVGVSYVAPQVADNYGERAERLGEKAIAAAREEERARALAEDGWGYSPETDGDGWGPDND